VLCEADGRRSLTTSTVRTFRLLLIESSILGYVVASAETTRYYRSRRLQFPDTASAESTANLLEDLPTINDAVAITDSAIIDQQGHRKSSRSLTPAVGTRIEPCAC